MRRLFKWVNQEVEMAKFKDIYQQELSKIKEQCEAFSKAHPNVAPMLEQNATDPDVERLLEGFAYLSAQIQEVIDDQIPEFSGGLIKKFFPHYLRPLPSATIMAFTPKTELSESFTVKKGTNFSSIPVDKTPCVFRLCSDCIVHPLVVESARMVSHSGEQHYIELTIALSGIDLESWWVNQLTFHLGGLFAEAAQLYYLLLRHVDKIELTNDHSTLTLPKHSITAAGFSDDEALLPYPAHASTAYRVLQEYFLMPQKYLYITLDDLDKWSNRGESNAFKIRFFLNPQVKSIPTITKKSFVLNTAPAINLFDYDAKPITLDHQHYQYPIYPDTANKKHYEIYAVKEVIGYQQGQAEPKNYVNIDDCSHHANKACYEIINKSSVTTDGLDSYISMLYNPNDNNAEQETLSILLECSNGNLPEYLSKGDINVPTGNSPDLLSFENLYVPTPYKTPPVEDEWMWRLQSMLNMNYLSIATAENLRELLRFHLFLNKGRHITRSFSERQIDSIEEITVQSTNRMISGILMQGQKIQLRCRVNDFSSKGEAFLFISVIDRFFATYIAMNTFTLLELTDAATGEQITWPIRIGEQLLN